MLAGQSTSFNLKTPEGFAVVVAQGRVADEEGFAQDASSNQTTRVRIEI